MEHFKDTQFDCFNTLLFVFAIIIFQGGNLHKHEHDMNISNLMRILVDLSDVSFRKEPDCVNRTGQLVICVHKYASVWKH